MYNRVEHPEINYNSVLGLLPPLKVDELEAASQDETVIEAVSALSNYLGMSAHYSETGQESCVMSRGENEIFVCAPDIPPLNEKQAWQVIHKLNAEFKLMGVAQLSKLNTIMIQTNHDSYALEYGKASAIHALFINFNSTTGFTAANNDKFNKSVARSLEKHFLNWNLHLRKGYIIPECEQRQDATTSKQIRHGIFDRSGKESIIATPDSENTLRK